MFDKWNLRKHILGSSLLSFSVGLFVYFLIKPSNLSSTIGIITGEGLSAIYAHLETNFGFHLVIVISLLVFIFAMNCYKLLKDK